MQLTVDIKTLKDELAIIGDALDASDNDPMAGHYLFRVGADWLEILGGHQSTGLCGYVKLSDLPDTGAGEDVVEFTVDGKRVVGFLGDSKTGDITIAYENSGKAVTLSPTSYRVDLKLNGLDHTQGYNFETDYKAAVDKGSTGSFDSDTLDDAFDATSPFVGKGMAQAGFGLLDISMEDDTCLVRAADGKSVAVYRHPGLEGSFNIRKEKISACRNFLKRAEGTVTLYDGENYYFLVDEDGRYFGIRKVDFGFPTMPGLEPFTTDTPTVVKVDRQALLGAIKRLKWSLGDDQKRMGFEVKGAAGGTGCTMRLFTKNISGSLSEELIEDGIVREVGDEDDLFYMDYNYALSGLDKFDGDIITMYVVSKSRGFHYAKFMRDSTDGDDTVTKVVLLALMRAPRGS